MRKREKQDWRNKEWAGCASYQRVSRIYNRCPKRIEEKKGKKNILRNNDQKFITFGRNDKPT